MVILVTGAGGQLGTELKRCVAASNDVRINASKWIFATHGELNLANLAEAREQAAMLSPNVIINCAAYTNVDKAETEPELADLINNLAIGNLALAARQQGATLIHISTDYVFDGKRCTPYKPDDPTSPLGVYGRTKLNGERAVTESGCNYLIFRTSWLYSSNGHNFVGTMLRLTKEKEILKVVYDQVGSPTNAADLAHLLCHVVADGLYGTAYKGIYHFSNHGVCSWYDLAKAVCTLAGNKCHIEPCLTSEYPTKAQRPSYSVLDCSKTETAFGFGIPYWRDSLSGLDLF